MEGRLDDYKWAGPYMVSNQVVAVNENSDIYTLSDLEGKTLAVQSTTKPEGIFLKRTDSRIPKLGNLISLEHRDLIYTFLGKGYADAVGAHEESVIQYMKDYDVSVTKDEKAAIKKAAQQFISDNSSEALKEMTADEDTVEELLTLYTIRSKMQKAIEAEADTNVTDEEANERGYTMMTISTTSHQDDSGNTVEYTDDEKKQLKETANKIEDAVKNGKTLEDAAKDEDQQTTTGAYASDDSTLDTSVKKALDDLKEGETSDVIETDSALYIVRLDSETDKDATEKNRQNIIDKRKSDHYNEVLEGWQKKDGWKVNKKNVAKISFKNSLTQQDPNASTETQTSTETQNAESTQ